MRLVIIFSYRLFKKKQKVIKKKELKEKIKEKIAIIIQGPLINEDNFTIETIEFYSNLYGNTNYFFIMEERH